MVLTWLIILLTADLKPDSEVCLIPSGSVFTVPDSVKFCAKSPVLFSVILKSN